MKSLQRDLSLAHTLNQFSGLVYCPTLNSYSALNNASVTISIDDATLKINSDLTTYPIYFLPGYIKDRSQVGTMVQPQISVPDTTSILTEGRQREVLFTEGDPKYWYPTTLAPSDFDKQRQNPFKISYFVFHIGNSKTYITKNDWFKYSDSGVFLIQLETVFQTIASQIHDLNINVQVDSTKMAYSQYSQNSSMGIRSLSKNLIIDYIQRFPERLI